MSKDLKLLKDIIREIEQTEGLRIVVKHPDGRKVRGDKKLAFDGYRRRRKDNSTVRSFVSQRLGSTFQGYLVEVVRPEGQKVHGGTLLGTVREAYAEGPRSSRKARRQGETDSVVRFEPPARSTE